MMYDRTLQENQEWWEKHFPNKCEITVAKAAKCLGVKADKLITDPTFPSFRDGRNYKVTIPRLARWQTDRAFGKYKETE